MSSVNGFNPGNVSAFKKLHKQGGPQQKPPTQNPAELQRPKEMAASLLPQGVGNKLNIQG